MSSIEYLKTALYRQLPFARIADRLQRNNQLVLRGAAGCLKAFITAFLVESNRRVLWIAPRSSAREEALADLSQLLSNGSVGMLPVPESHDDITPFEARIFRSRALLSWTTPGPYALVTEPAATWVNLLPSPDELDKIRINLIPGQQPGRDRLAERLVKAGYTRVEMAENRGDYAVRGHIMDIFPYTHDTPLRLEFWGEQLESLRCFDPATQRTLTHLQNATLFLSQPEGENDTNLISYMSPEDVLFIEEPEDCRLLAEQASGEGIWDSLFENNPTLYWGYPKQDIPRIDLNSVQQEDSGGHIGRLTESLNQLAGNRSKVYIACDNEGQKDRLQELLADRNINSMPHFLVAHFSGGFHLPDGALSLLTDHQIFRRSHRRRTYFRLRNFSPIQHADTLSSGDYIVHEDYGIGCYLGLKSIKVGGHLRECLQIAYRGDVKLYVRLESLKKVQKYSGREGFEPPLTRIGRGEWEKIRKRAKRAVDELADDLVKLYALRSSVKGFPNLKDGSLQRELETGFEYEETPDQLKAIQDVKQDMEESIPMDRLVCGDVGYGKTEVALRAAFKAVVSGRQVGILVPTTLLAQQHHNSFSVRLKDTAVEIEMLSRFRTKSVQKDILKRLKDGRIDIIIGTHRLLSKDVKFNNLGLLIVDEEHRFGVRHKETLKKLRSQVDGLTLTATPIPRTLHMAMIGARDMSLINTAPQDRLPIETEIAPFSQDLITEAILREVDRGGQVYFVHNRVRTIDTIKGMLERWLPQVRFVVAHGQMPERLLEETMNDFLDKKYDGLISTMIIESGLDLPNVNTMIVNRADRFGLAQLYQLRGRIGRSNRQAYAYLLTPPKLPAADPAYKRLDAIRHCSYLGAGFQVAMRDLEIRGAGEIFGAKQSGFMHAVGFDLYRKMLEEAVAKLKEDSRIGTGEIAQDTLDFEPKIDFPFDAYLPNDYVETPGQRVELYRRLSGVTNYESLYELIEEITDRYGTPPLQTRHLFDLIELKLGCLINGFPKLKVNERYLLAEIGVRDGYDWQDRLAKIVGKLDDLAVEFSGGDPPQIILRWDADDEWTKKISSVKKLLKKLS